jgi:hypothetical protein
MGTRPKKETGGDAVGEEKEEGQNKEITCMKQLVKI